MKKHPFVSQSIILSNFWGAVQTGCLFFCLFLNRAVLFLNWQIRLSTLFKKIFYGALAFVLILGLSTGVIFAANMANGAPYHVYDGYYVTPDYAPVEEKSNYVLFQANYYEAYDYLLPPAAPDPKQPEADVYLAYMPDDVTTWPESLVEIDGRQYSYDNYGLVPVYMASDATDNFPPPPAGFNDPNWIQATPDCIPDAWVADGRIGGFTDEYGQRWLLPPFTEVFADAPLETAIAATGKFPYGTTIQYVAELNYYEQMPHIQWLIRRARYELAAAPNATATDVDVWNYDPWHYIAATPPPAHVQYYASEQQQPADNYAPDYPHSSYNQSGYIPMVVVLPEPGDTINDYLFRGWSTCTAVFDVRFYRVENGNLVPVINQTFGHEQSAFRVWADLNNVHNVSLVSHSLIMSTDILTLPSGQMTSGTNRVVDITLSSEFRYLLDGENGWLLAESLSKSFISLWQPVSGFIRVNLIVSGEVVHSTSASN